MKKKALLTSILTIALCLSLIAGSTFALFTSSSSVNIAVTAGKVNATATIEDLEVYSPKMIELETGNIVDDTNAKQNDTTFSEGGTALLDGDTLTLDKIIPGDKATFKIKITNNSTVTAKYRTVIESVEDTGLFAGLKFKIGEETAVGSTAWAELPNEPIELACEVTLPIDAGDTYKNTSCKIRFRVEAVQGNTQTVDYGIQWSGNVATQADLMAAKSTWTEYNEETGDISATGNLFTISTPELLAAFAQYVNEGNCVNSDRVVLAANMDLCNIDWTPIGTAEHPFTGRIFDGQGYTISNLTVNGGTSDPTDLEATNVGLFGCTYTNGSVVEIMNLNLCNVDIYAKNSAGAVIGCLDTAQSVYWLAGYTGVHDIKLTGKVTIEGGNSGAIAGSPVSHWALQTGFNNIEIDVEDGSYLSNVNARKLSGDGVGGALGGVVAVAAWDRGSTNIKSNLDVIGVAGNVGGIVGVGNQVWYNINYTGDVTVKGVTPAEDGKYNYGLAIGGFAPVWHHQDMSQEKRDSVVATGNLKLELTDGNVVTTNGQASNAIGGFYW